MSESTQTSRRALIAAGFQELDRAASFLDDDQLRDLDASRLLTTMREAANPDQALLLLIRLLERADAVRSVFTDDGEDHYADAVPLIRLLGASQALGEFLIRRPDHVDLVTEADPGRHVSEVEDGHSISVPETVASEELRRRLLSAVRADAAGGDGDGDGGRDGDEDDDAVPPTAALDDDFTVKDATVALRIAYRREITALALRDLCAEDPLAYQPLVSHQLSDLAAAALDAALAVARAERRDRERRGEESESGRTLAERIEFAVIGMGKCGARELNFISDVDVIYVHRGPEDVDAGLLSETAIALAGGLTRIIGSAAPEPGLWEVDANLRPEGKDGPLSRTLDSHREYYRRWAHGWEFQALLKARPVAGSRRLGDDYIEAIWPQVWTSSQQEGFVENVQRMRRRVFEHIPDAEVDREIKLGSGGLRDIEFTVQLLQLVHGRVDETLQVRDTLTAVDRLARGEYMASKDQEAMSACYRRLRLWEHRVQMSQMRRTHLFPRRDEDLRALALAAAPPGMRKRPAAEDLQKEWRRVRREVASFHEQIFYRPLLSTTAVLSDDEVRLSSEAAQDRLAALGYADTRSAMRHIESLTSGVTRRATVRRRILPMMLGWFADGVDPDGGLLAFRRLSESLGQSPWYLTMLRDSSVAAERLSHILSSSRFIADLLEHSPESARWLGDDSSLTPRRFEQLWQEVSSQLDRHEKDDGQNAIRLTRLVRQREILRIAVADASGLLDQEQVGGALAEVDRAATLGALRVAENEIFAEDGRHIDFLVVAMGRQGGAEISYGSDMDALFVHRAVEGAESSVADEQAQKLAARLTALLQRPTKPAVKGEYPLQVDADLRPEGRKGPLSRSVESYREYYRRWMEVWERQALLRARPVAGSDDLAAEFMGIVDEVRYGPAPSSGQIREIRRIKARVEAERLPRGADPSRHVKLGRGGLSDVEWLVQLIQLEDAEEYPELRTPSTLPALEAMVQMELVAAEDAETLADAWRLCTRVRSAVKIWTGKTSDVLPSSRRDLEAVARWCGFGAGGAATFEEHYLRTTRRCRQVYERLFYGEVG
ncbi:MAG: bifunctional [glutamine synthetase] adenylyltransferase/[glutamine synthetase]-adenylyl-L-tyrosine phosphorylase [Nesterenkonia sp.]|nr:bifunctional [glutamine synthetase] adenylyltransferase/[glutamine synthetase]-adenylyl-L-tyrosine phosphorylase [Nesterenkonia sp.]